MSPYMGNPKYTSVKGILKVELTRLHSSRMRTARVLTVSPSMLCTGGSVCSQEVCVPGPGPGGVSGPGGVYLVLGVCLLLGGVPGPGGCTGSRGGVPGWGVVSGPGGGAPGLGGVPGPGGCTWLGCLLLGRCVPGHGGGVRYSPPVNRMTNRCKNITLPQTSFAGGKYLFH